MDGGLRLHQAVPGPLVFPGQHQGLLDAPVRFHGPIRRKGHHRVAQGYPHPHLQGQLGDGGLMVIHIADAGGPGAKLLRKSQPGPCQHRPFIQPGLGGKYLFKQPGFEGIVVRIAPEHRHGGVGVGVDQAGHKELAPAGDPPLGRYALGRRAHQDHAPVPYPHVPGNYRGIIHHG